jgi:hypothetical protein
MKQYRIKEIKLSSENFLSTKLHGMEIEQTAVLIIITIINIPSPFPLRRRNLSHVNLLIEH